VAAPNPHLRRYVSENTALAVSSCRGSSKACDRNGGRNAPRGVPLCADWSAFGSCLTRRNARRRGRRRRVARNVHGLDQRSDHRRYRRGRTLRSAGACRRRLFRVFKCAWILRRYGCNVRGAHCCRPARSTLCFPIAGHCHGNNGPCHCAGFVVPGSRDCRPPHIELGPTTSNDTAQPAETARPQSRVPARWGVTNGSMAPMCSSAAGLTGAVSRPLRIVVPLPHTALARPFPGPSRGLLPT